MCVDHGANGHIMFFFSDSCQMESESTGPVRLKLPPLGAPFAGTQLQQLMWWMFHLPMLPVVCNTNSTQIIRSLICSCFFLVALS